jgi:hypothetical protein
MREKAKAAVQEEKDARARALAAAESQGGTTITINPEILPHRSKTVISMPICDISSSESESESERIEATPPRDLPLLHELPSSTAPPRLERSDQSRAKRARTVTINYAKLDAGDSQEYKKAKRH